MSQKRRLRRVADKAKLSPVRLEAPPHGCVECCSSEWRTGVTKELLTNLRLGDSEVLCRICGAWWKVSVFPVGPNEELHVSFNPIANEPLN
jgi:hypothetical protein